jgi:hypothetical protein
MMIAAGLVAWRTFFIDRRISDVCRGNAVCKRGLSFQGQLGAGNGPRFAALRLRKALPCSQRSPSRAALASARRSQS